MTFPLEGHPQRRQMVGESGAAGDLEVSLHPGFAPLSPRVLKGQAEQDGFSGFSDFLLCHGAACLLDLCSFILFPPKVHSAPPHPRPCRDAGNGRKTRRDQRGGHSDSKRGAEKQHQVRAQLEWVSQDGLGWDRLRQGRPWEEEVCGLPRKGGGPGWCRAGRSGRARW